MEFLFLLEFSYIKISVHWLYFSKIGLFLDFLDSILVVVGFSDLELFSHLTSLVLELPSLKFLDLNVSFNLDFELFEL